MARNFGVPPTAEQVRSVVEARCAEAQQENGERVNVEWRGEMRYFPVISLPIGMLYYNPETHRIRAQRSLDPERERDLSDDPWSPQAQAYLERLLRCKPASPDAVDPDFEVLREDLRQYGQKEAGLITRDGILVNGNTRRVALKEVGAPFIRVGVLPESAAWDDITSVELALQLRKEYKREYSYINRLLAIDEEFSKGRREDVIAREFRVSVGHLRKDRWVFNVIREMIERSKTDGGVGLRWIDFEDNKEKLRELQRAYEAQAATDRDAAEVLKEARLSLIVLGHSKTDVRLAESNFHEKYLDPKLPPGLKPAAPASAPIAVPGLPVAVPGAPAKVAAARALTDKLLRAKALAQATAKADPAQMQDATATLRQAQEAFDRALDPAGRDTRLRIRKAAAVDRLSDACDELELCINDLAQSAAARALDEVGFDEMAVRLRRTLERLARQAARTIPQPGEGVGWLIERTREAQ